MEAVQGKTYTGRVKTFDAKKGYGFIRVDGIKDDIFVYYKSISMEGYKKLDEGEEVTFEVVQGPKGLQADNVQRTQVANAGE